jgi:protein involved in polysaccharide export with SLBB domain
MAGAAAPSVFDSHSFSLSQPQQQLNIILPSDNSIDENEYIIGAGDVFFITSTESASIRYTAAVDQSGNTYIQNVGLLKVGRVPYAQAKKLIAEHISSKLKKPSEIYVTLIQTKNAVVSFTGKIRSPGSYNLPGTMRLLDAIRHANNGELPLPSEANLREVVCASGDSAAVYDLLAYLYKNDNTQNPYIYPGSQIRINDAPLEVFISGAMKNFPPPGHYPIREGETLKEFLTMFALYTTADTNGIIVFRARDNTSKTVNLSETDYVLNDLDAITVPVLKNYPGMHTVSIFGEIASPGRYPIIENSTTARQVIDKAGGIRETGNIDQAVILRMARGLPERFAGAAPPMSAVRPERGSSMAIASTSLDYAVIRLVLYNADKITLEPDDQIVIPKKDDFVYISGGVRSPGAYPFLPSKDYSYYVTQAGGYSRNADKSNVQVFVKYGDVVQSIEPRCVEPGSVIVVPTSIQYKFTTQVLLPLISTISAVLSASLAIYMSTSQAK